ncbi:MAG TPA: carboxypeptidase-like regulatory domain-containing protein [Thermoanaerobaculia bacterium]
MLAALLLVAATVQGTVPIDDGEPLPGCVVRLGTRAETITDAGGRYTFFDVPPGRYDLDFELFWLKSTRQHVTVAGRSRPARHRPRDPAIPRPHLFQDGARAVPLGRSACAHRVDAAPRTFRPGTVNT